MSNTQQELEKPKSDTLTLDEDDWDYLLRRIKAKQCTPFIGAGACDGTLPLGKDLACNWAKSHGYPLPDRENLARVAQYLIYNKNDEFFPKDEIRDIWSKTIPPDFSKPDEPHHLLADLELPIYITTNYDGFMFDALKSHGKDPQRELCRWNPTFDVLKIPSIFMQNNEYKPSTEKPIVYHLHGHHSIPQSMVLTNDDYVDFLVQLTKDNDILPPSILTAIAGNSLLFVGYSLEDWDFRVLFRGLINSLGGRLSRRSIAVQLAPKLQKTKPQEQKKAIEYLNSYFSSPQGFNVRIFWGTASEFAKELRQRLENSKK